MLRRARFDEVVEAFAAGHHDDGHITRFAIVVGKIAADDIFGRLQPAELQPVERDGLTGTVTELEMKRQSRPSSVKRLAGTCRSIGSGVGKSVHGLGPYGTRLRRGIQLLILGRSNAASFHSPAHISRSTRAKP